MMRRSLFVVGLAVGLTLVAAPAVAEELEDYLSKAAEADYAGTQVVVTVWEGRSTARIMEVERIGELLMVGSDGREVVAGNGKLSSAAGGVVLSDWDAGSHLSSRYTTGTAEPAQHLGREAIEVTIFEYDVARARIVFDAATWAPMVTEVFDGDGDRFRFASFTEFSPAPRRAFEKMDDAGDVYEVVTRIDETAMPGSAAEYRRLDVYRNQDGVVQAFYGDGLFSFSVFQLEGAQGERRFDGAETLVVDDAAYQVLVNPTDVWVRWASGARTYLLVGDLPPDHLEAVLTELPEPQSGGFLARLWRSVFGG